MNKIRPYLMQAAATLLTCAAVAAPLAVQAQTAVATTLSAQPLTGRIGFVNTDRLFSETRAAVESQNKLKREFSSREHQLTSLGERLQKAVNKFERDQADLSEAQASERRRELVAMDNEFQQKRQEFQEDLNNRKAEEMQALLERANRAVIWIAAQDGYDVILQEVVFIKPQLNITDKVIAELDAGR